MIHIKNDFKTIQIALYLVDLDDSRYACHRYLLPRLLTSATDKIQSRQLMNTKMENLYGAYFKARTERMGNLSVISLILTIVDPHIVKDNHLLQEAIELFDDVLKNHSSFNQDVFDDEKRMLIEQWETLKDKKRLYARERFTELFFKGDSYGYPLSGTLKDIKRLKVEDVYEYYRQSLNKQAKYVIVNGAVEKSDLIKIENVLGQTRPIQVPFVTLFRAPKEVKHVVEETVMQQAIIKMGYILPVYRHDALYDATVILDTIIGGYPESRLFKVIREEEGLCYDISSSYDYYKGVLMISSGIDLSKVNHALKRIHELIVDLMENGVTLLELNHAKAYYIHQIKSSLDSQSTLTKRAFVREMLDYQESVEEKLNKILNVTIDEVNMAAKKLVLDTTYVLKGETHD